MDTCIRSAKDQANIESDEEMALLPVDGNDLWSIKLSLAVVYDSYMLKELKICMHLLF